MKRILLLLGVLLLFSTSRELAFGQDPNGITLPTIIPPGPTAQQFQRFLGYSADGSTGTVSLSIPLYTLTFNELRIPFSLKYNSSGIRVNQGPGVIGNGWTMFPGLRITRTIMGKSDRSYTTSNIQTASGAATDYLAQVATKIGPNSETGGIDGQPDIFTLHLPDYNGSFILQWNGSGYNAVSIPSSPLQIALVNPVDLSFGFIVTDDKGRVYAFDGDKEFTSDNTEVTSWLLHTITFPGSGQAISFQYLTAGGLTANTAPSSSRSIYDEYDNEAGYYSNIAMALNPNYDGSGYYGYSDNSMGYDFNPTEKTLASVTFPSGSIQLTYQSSGGYNGFLQHFKVLDNNATVLKDIVFNNASNNLQSVAFPDGATYSMQYRAQASANVFDQDRWGFDNNKGNTTLIPAMNLDIRILNPNLGGDGYTTSNIAFPGANREADTAAMKSNILQKIMYPTGGWTSFVYEPHQFMHNGAATYGGGLRIKEMDTYDPTSQQTMVKTYKYGASESGLAQLVSYPEDASFIDAIYLYAAKTNPPVDYSIGKMRRISVGTQSHYRFFGLGNQIWYDEVAEYSKQGKTVYHYTYTPNTITTYNQNGFDRDILTMMNSLVFASPDLTETDVYKGQSGTYTLLKKDQRTYLNYYSSSVPTAFTGLIVDPLATIVYKDQPIAPDNKYWSSTYYSSYNSYFPSAMPFYAANYQIRTGIDNLTSTTSTDYSGSTPVPSVTSDDYTDAIAPYNMTVQTRTGSNGESYVTNKYYPTSSSIPGLTSSEQSMAATLAANNRLTALIEQTMTKNGAAISGTINDYRDWGNSLLLPEYIKTNKGGGGFEQRLQYQNYDSEGNVTGVAQVGGPPVSYQWGYNKQLPVAKATNAPAIDIFYDGFEDGDGNNTTVAKTGHSSFTGYYSHTISGQDAGLYTLSYWQYSGGAWTFVTSNMTLGTANFTIALTSGTYDDIRFYPANAQMSTYTYDPLVGMTSATDAKSQTTYYEYDSFQRLMNIRDNNRNITKHIDYHYQNQ